MIFLYGMFDKAVGTGRHWKPNTHTVASFQPNSFSLASRFLSGK